MEFAIGARAINCTCIKDLVTWFEQACVGADTLYNAGGVPLLAQGQSMFGDPLHLFVIAARGAAWAWDAKYLVAKWLFATALGLIVLRLSSSVPPLPFSPSPPLPFSPSPLLPAALVTVVTVVTARPSGLTRSVEPACD